MKHCCLLILLPFCLAACLSMPLRGQGSAPDIAHLYVRAATWPETMAATHRRVQDWRKAEMARLGIEAGPWHTTGPIPAKDLTDALFPEAGVDLKAVRTDGKPAWSEQGTWRDGFLHSLPTQNSTTTYLYRILTARAPVEAALYIGNSDGMTIWLNGVQVHSQDVERGADSNQVRISASLAAGENQLLLKIFNKRDNCQFCFSIGKDVGPELWNRVRADFPVESSWMEQDFPRGRCGEWFNAAETLGLDTTLMNRASGKIGDGSSRPQRDFAMFDKKREKDVCGRLRAYALARRTAAALNALDRFDPAALNRMIDDLDRTFPDYPAQGFRDKVSQTAARIAEIRRLAAENPEAGIAQIAEVTSVQRAIALANPLLDFDKLLLVKRSAGNLGLPQNWQGNCAVSTRGYDNEIATLAYKDPAAQPVPLFRPPNREFVGDVDLHFDAGKMLFSMPGSHGRWQIWEIGADGNGLRQVTPGEEPDVDNYDACYLPNDDIIFGSTRCFQGIPCVGGGNTVANLCRMDANGQNARMLGFDQDHNWCPTVLNNGQVMYTRWEYSDTPHYFTRLVFRMNPDGTGQMEHYKSNSFWPNSTFYARPIPNDPTQFVAIVSGHHGVARMGELVIFDPAKSRFEANGVVQRIPGWGKKVEPIIADTLVDAVWPKFLHPYPLSAKYFLVSCKPTPDASWGIYLVDVFDNMTLLAEIPAYALFEPLPLRKTVRPPVVQDKVRLDRQDALVYLADIYKGDGLKGVPQGTVKNLRLFAMHYCYPQMGGHINIGVEGPWDVHQILGTVPVEGDGSAFFRVPANTPIAVQPIDEDGQALQIMRSWFTAMPGETLSCIGCHEKQNMAPPSSANYAARRAPSEIAPWRGPARGFSFKRDVQPVLDRRCVGCHNGGERPDGTRLLDFSRKEQNGWGNFTPSYLALHPYVRRPGPESDYHLQTPLEFSANTSELIQMLQKGHHGVQLDPEDFDRLYTWIDLNVPDHGTWGEHKAIPHNFHRRRIEMKTKYANRPEDPEAIPDLPSQSCEFISPGPVPLPPNVRPTAAGWPFGPDEAVKRQQAAGSETRRTVDLGDGVKMEFVLVPAGEFVMGGDGAADEWPKAAVKIQKPFWLGATEVTNRQYARFDAAHRSGFQDQHHKDHTTPGYSAEGPDEPVVRVTWKEAMAFCGWLGAQSGGTCSLPTEAQWEWACRAGAGTPFSYGNAEADFSPFANLADASIALLAVTGINPQPIPNPSPYEDFIPKDGRFNDGAKVHAPVAHYQPNAWGLFDMHGNVAEWTLSTYKPYPYVSTDGRDDGHAAGKKVVRGGSWRDRPKRATASYRLAYESWQPVYNVGFRVMMPVQ
ncbi:MAG TPA: SUMF1/EgtB/PvdO family nonheme iron enzyme [Candidatus Hydrogenedentes bacterium]|nr:SUMF1/EgtB/PvdO family nonheme iron enzyme [Candidatus Hydrogenedentota bacterium]HRT22171.1 SUMF1/EgtB/PvdO family nonheme iron enzyme [Candidatus Hydrogenedentota bacterium]HRT66918.1 SUMF1/EgtB/PvdO family nonheme iron enzyme [Candidatus Hydrogenedentota bacterium]